MGKHNVSRVKELPASVFYELWHNAGKYESKQLYIHEYTSIFSSHYINSIKYDIDPDVFYELLSLIYKMYHYTIKDLIQFSGLTRAAFGYKYCIPIRTLEDWVKKDASPDYVRLLIIKEEKLFRLPKYIHIKI